MGPVAYGLIGAGAGAGVSILAQIVGSNVYNDCYRSLPNPLAHPCYNERGRGQAWENKPCPADVHAAAEKRIAENGAICDARHPVLQFMRGDPWLRDQYLHMGLFAVLGATAAWAAFGRKKP